MKYFLVTFLVFSLFACSSDTEQESNEETITQKTDAETVKNVEVLFDKNTFDNPVKEQLLKELKICSDKNQGPEDYMHPSCTPLFFELFPFSEKIAIENGFILLIKAKTNDFPLRRILVFMRERGELVKVNGFIANLIGVKKTASQFDDLMLRFVDKDQGEDVFYNCLFSWDGTTYKYKSVEVIEGANWGGPVKAELKDSISKEVFKDIMGNKMIF